MLQSCKTKIDFAACYCRKAKRILMLATPLQGLLSHIPLGFFTAGIFTIAWQTCCIHVTLCCGPAVHSAEASSHVMQVNPNAEIEHAISVCEAMQGDDYETCFRLYANAPRMGRALMDISHPRQRFEALTMMCDGFRPSLPVPHIARILGFVARPSSASQGASGGASSSGPDLQGPSQESLPGSSHAQYIGRHAPAVSTQPSFRSCHGFPPCCHSGSSSMLHLLFETPFMR